MEKQQKGSTVAEVEALVAPTLEGLGFSVWDVRFEKEGPNWYLRVLIDHADGAVMDTDACEVASRAINPLIDEVDPIEQSYFLEVGSPGLGRRLTRAEHFAAVQGSEVTVHFIRAENGVRDLIGILQLVDGKPAIVTPEGTQILAMDTVSYIKLNDDLDLE